MLDIEDLVNSNVVVRGREIYILEVTYDKVYYEDANGDEKYMYREDLEELLSVSN